ncbi:MAG: 3-hydroxyacyl-[acyl-carrier-protein] dehydratase FabZ [Candidatus Anoxychlamydiales bacterium]|nr:3-hydroxyacyl-[acyl-carrier-protein] dehydratase FabZ [Candidatus Anoxychlamydiales bacterium]
MSKKPVLDHRDIKNILPHRYPFLLVDKVSHLDLDKNEIIGIKNVTINEHFFEGHFPEAPIMPGVLIIEALAQTGGILVHQKGFVGKIAVLLNIKDVKFRKPVYPGDILEFHCTGVHISAKGGKINAKAIVDNNVCVEAAISFALVEKNKL